MADFESLAGRLLVASPELLDPNFARAVVLLMEHDESGAIGIVLNRPTDADVLDHLPAWHTAAVNPRVVFVGGPVGEGGGIGLARGDGGVPLEGWASVLGVRAVDLGDDPDIDAPLEARVFVGYSGWGPGQLESEIATGSWLVVSGSQEDAFTHDPASLWSEVLERSGGRNALLSTYPIDPRLN
jgi:putative transcriptional regulator